MAGKCELFLKNIEGLVSIVKNDNEKRCPKCGSEEIDKGHVGPEHYCGETYYDRCNECDYQWNHQ